MLHAFKHTLNPNINKSTVYGTATGLLHRHKHTTVNRQVALNTIRHTKSQIVLRSIHAHHVPDRLDSAALPDIVNQTPEEFAAELDSRNELHRPAKLETALEALINHHSNTPHITTADESTDNKPHKDLPDAQTVITEKLLPKSELNFNEVKKAFAVKTNYELIRSLIVFRLCAWEWLVMNARTLCNISYKILGTHITNFVLRHTFFAHFCAGESGDSIGPVINKLELSGVGAILDYAAEADVDKEHKRDRDGVVSAQTYNS